MLVRRFAQDPDDLRERLVEEVAGRLRVRDAEALVLGAGRSAPGAELEATVAQVVEHRDALGHARRVVHRRRQVEDARPEVHALGLAGDVAHEHLARGDVRVLLQEVVLGEPGVLEVVPVTGDRDGGLVQQPPVLEAALLVGRRLVGHVTRVEDPEFHDGARRSARPDDGLQLGVRVQPERAAVATDAAVLRATERRLLVALHGVDPHVAGPQPPRHPHRAAGVLAEHVVVEAELGVVGDRDRLLLLVEGNHDDHRTEDLLLDDLHVGPAVRDQRRLEVPALLQVRRDGCRRRRPRRPAPGPTRRSPRPGAGAPR